MSQNISVAVIGAGISGLAAAIELSAQGHRVKVYEKNASFGGRGRVIEKDGFLFDMGPSWYWMPDVFENFLNAYGKSVSQYFQLVRLDPSFRIFGHDEVLDVPAGRQACLKLFEQREPGSSKFLDRFLQEAKYKYDTGMGDFVRKPSLSWSEFLDWRLIRSVFKLEMFSSLEKVVHRGVHDELLRQWLCFPVLFLGAKPSHTPALYSLMNYAEIELGTWYPMGGMTHLFKALYDLALEQGVQFEFNAAVSKIVVKDQRACGVISNGQAFSFDAVISSADYHHTEQCLLDPAHRQYSESYWESRVMAPSSLVFYLGVDRKVDGLLHHNLFFDESFDEHARSIYDHAAWPSDPLFYVCAPSKTDPGVAPQGMENLFILIPLAAGLKDDESEREKLFEQVLRRIQARTGVDLRPHVVVKMEMGPRDFENTYNSFKGNAYGLANTLRQTAMFKPRLKHETVDRLFFAGQLSHPGPGLPPSLISGQISARLVQQHFSL